MPRQARLDAPGTLHHVMIRGIERSLIFKDDQDRQDFIEQKSENTLIDKEETLLYFSKRLNRAVKAYKEFVEADEGEDESPFTGMEAGLLLVAGSFKVKVSELIERKKVDEEIVQTKRFRKRGSIGNVIKACQLY
jgi:hypothetical protein